MAQTTNQAAIPGNRLLNALTEVNRSRLLGAMERVSLDLRAPLYAMGQPIEHVYFPIVGVASIVTHTDHEVTVEIATIGNEGMVGVPVFLGVESMNGEAFQQVPGESYRMESASFRDALGQMADLVVMLQRYTYALFALVAQGVTCNRLHNPEQRASRWLLMTHDRASSDEFQLTQEFLAQMLGVRRATVSGVAGQLQRAGLITYRRGRITVVDRKGLERAACECYAIVRSEFDRVLGSL